MEQQPLRGFQAEWTRPQIESEQVVRLQEQVKHLQSMLVQKQSEVDTMNKWQFGDQYLGQDDVLKDQMNEYKARVSVQQERDVQEMADAAYQTVQTLQNLLDQKKEMLRQKDDHIARMREQMETQRKVDADTIANLREQITATGTSTLSKLHEAASRMESQGGHRQSQG